MPQDLNKSLAESNSCINIVEEHECLLQHMFEEANIATVAEQDLFGSLQKKLSDCKIDLAGQQAIHQASEQIAEQCICNAKW